jgi:hypothetical protein
MCILIVTLQAQKTVPPDDHDTHTQYQGQNYVKIYKINFLSRECNSFSIQQHNTYTAYLSNNNTELANQWYD